MLAGCGSSGSDDQGEILDSGVDQGAGEDATPLDLVTFVSLHGTFYEQMAAQWNVENPDRQVKIQTRVLPFDAMHQRLQMSLTTGHDVPDIADIEVGQFSNFMRGEVQLRDLTDVAAQYRDQVVEARMDLYSRDGQLFGLPTHVGAMLAFYNVPLLEEAGIDYTTLTNWDDFRAAGIDYYDATGNFLTTADTSAFWQTMLVTAQKGGEFIDANGNLTLDSPEVVDALTFLQGLKEDNVAGPIPGGQPDSEQAYGSINDGNFAALIMPSWFTSRFLAYMGDMEGQWAIAPPPSFADGHVVTVGGGGTGTAVPAASENADLAAEFLAFAKLSEAGNIRVWQDLGFDPVNTAMWDDEAVTHDPENRFNIFFRNNMFDALNLIGADNVGLMPSQKQDAWPVVG
ncbi:MAG: extracellular solute-binding protein, partial [Cellulomonadaceae bacterium]|nr:extracellular solute-binding protein [Cellulomonadaceae bacterium]